MLKWVRQKMLKWVVSKAKITKNQVELQKLFSLAKKGDEHPKKKNGDEIIYYEPDFKDALWMALCLPFKDFPKPSASAQEYLKNNDSSSSDESTGKFELSSKKKFFFKDFNV